MRANVHSIELGGAISLAVLASIKPGFVDGFEAITCLDRLRRLLKAMHAARQNVREAELRKLRQRTDHLDQALGAHPARQEVLARMMGRRQDGTVLVPLEPSGGPNDFNYDADRSGAACPFQAHLPLHRRRRQSGAGRSG